jgi:predicted O-linked N-acetylglucosamine transferase (SPINDLY family)
LLARALALHRNGAVAEAAACYTEVLRADPANADAHYYLALISCQHGRFAEGAELAGKSLALDPEHVRALVLLGRAFNALGRPDEALVSLERAIALAPETAQAHGNLGSVLSTLGRHAEAVDSYDRALALAPESGEDWFDRGVALAAVGRHGDAFSSFERAIACKPGFAEAHVWCAKMLSELRRHDEGLVVLDKALAMVPNLAEAWLGRGNILVELKRYDEAFAAFDRALAFVPNLAEAWVGRGNVLIRGNRYDDAFAAYERALAIKPDLAEAWLGRGNIFYKLKRYDEASSAYDRALALDANLAQAWLGRGNIFIELNRNEEAAAALDRALEKNPGLAEAWLGRGTVLTEFRRYDEAFAAYDRAMVLQPDLDYAPGARLYSKLHICDWTNLEAETAQLLTTAREQNRANPPFSILAMPSSPADQLQCARRCTEDLPAFRPISRGEIYVHDRIRIAYLSADFNEHPTGYLLAGLFARHDKSRFEVTGISFGPDQNSPMRQKLAGFFERFVDVSQRSDDDIADLIRRLELDIAVDLMGFTRRNRLSVLARRPAPIQVNYFGYIGTMGAPFIDYVIADRIALPFDQQPFYTEKIVHLPDCFLATDDQQQVAACTPSRQEAGLPTEGFVFCSFNNSYKLGRPVFELWMGLLHAVPGSVLWLTEANARMVVNLRREAQRSGIDGERLVFAPRVPLEQHLARQRLAGLFLDTIPYNAGATALAALWAGVPVLTVAGETFVGKMAASMLHAVGLPELVAKDLTDYEALAIKLANEPKMLSNLLGRLRENLQVMPLFDTDRFRRHIERAYTTMVDIHRRGESPRCFSVEPM